jgi:hypothetical protein
MSLLDKTSRSKAAAEKVAIQTESKVKADPKKRKLPQTIEDIDDDDDVFL